MGVFGWAMVVENGRRGSFGRWMGMDGYQMACILKNSQYLDEKMCILRTHCLRWQPVT